MNNLTYGLTITVVGMGGTLASLWFLAFAVSLLKRIFPWQETEDKNSTGGTSCSL